MTDELKGLYPLPGEPKLPDPYGDRDTVELSYYLSHMADFALRGPNPSDAKLFLEAAEWVRARANSYLSEFRSLAGGPLKAPE